MRRTKASHLLLPLFVLSAFFLQSSDLSGQEGSSVHQEHRRAELGRDDLRSDGADPASSRPDTCEITHTVFGWHPYWLEDSYEQHDFNLLSDVSYFSYEVNTTTGGYNSIHRWRTTKLVDYAKASGTRVNLCVTLFSDHATLFENPQAVQTLIDSLVSLVRLRDADGVNIDFEGIPASQKENLTSLIASLSERFEREDSDWQISMALPAVDWHSAYDVAAMASSVDLFIIMGYGYHWGGSKSAGPVAPKHSGRLWAKIDLTRSIDSYLSRGVPKAQLALGLPWYGFNWPTESDEIASATTGRGSSRTYKSVHSSYAIDTSRWDTASSTPWIASRAADASWHQTWFDGPRSLKDKYELAQTKGIAGIGIWALGYDGGVPAMWDAIHEVFGDCNATACNGELYDMGGPDGVYHPDDEWSYTIAPPGATSLEIQVESYDLEDDQLALYAGRDTLSEVLATLSGRGGPTTINVPGPYATLSFRSGRDLEGEGFHLGWICSQVPLSVEEGKQVYRLYLR